MRYLRSLVGAFLGVVAGRMVYEFVDELVGLDAFARGLAQGVSS